ncbi:MAG TPA: metal ABC transporter permease [Planctomycetota bacterium]|nr:metal ABC transporter permease [Planctomycetota bacterium]
MNEPGFMQVLSQTPLLQRALAAGALAGASCAILSPLVVLRRMSFIGDGMAHAAFGGIGLALFLLSGANYDDPMIKLITMAFCLTLGISIAYVSRGGDTERLAEDSAIGIAFSVSMALGALFLKLRQSSNPQYVTSMDVFLFGSMLNISPGDVWLLAGLSVTVLACMIVLQKEMLFYTFNARLAEASGLNVGVFHYLFMILLVVTVVTSSRLVGIILVSASLVLPGVTGLKVASRLAPAMLVAVAAGASSFVFGTFAAYTFDVPSGSAIILIQFAYLLLASVLHALKTRHRSTH